MKPNTDKPKTAKARRRFRGLEVAQAALLLVLGVAVALAMYFVVNNMFASAPVPSVQLDTYRSGIYGDTATVVLKFGRPGVVRYVVLFDGRTNGPIDYITFCFSSESPDQGLRVVPGQRVNFICKLASGKYWTNVMVVHVRFWDEDVTNIRWVPS